MRLTGSARDALGAQVRLRGPGLEGVVVRQLEAGTGEGNQNAGQLHFGLGAAQGPFELELRWPGGDIERLDGVEPGARVDWARPGQEPRADEQGEALDTKSGPR